MKSKLAILDFVVIIFLSCAFVIYNQNNLASCNGISSPMMSLLHFNAKAGQPVTHMRLQQLQLNDPTIQTIPDGQNQVTPNLFLG